jgi:antitoxin component YwqK of YwqJK toxin-antitoxin module
MTDADATRVPYDAVEFDDQRALLNGVPFSGILYADYSDGTPEAVYQYVEGLPAGLQRRWHSNGQTQAEWEAIRGRGSAWSREWHPNGSLKCERINEDGRPVIVREWSEEGDLLSETIKRG